MSVWRYDGKRAVVTGCSSGMGEATVRELIPLGAFVIGVDVKEPTVPVDEYIKLDLTDPTAIEAAAARVGSVSALFNCAGLSNGGGSPTQVMHVNFLGLRAFTEAVVPAMEAGSAIASIASLGGQGWEGRVEVILELLGTQSFDEGARWCEAHPELLEGGAYGFSKQSIIVYTKFRTVNLASRGIRITSISPGVTQTPMLIDSARALGGEEALDRVPAPLGRRSQPEEQARVLIFLNSDAASYVTGQNLWTDAGFMGGLQTGTLNPLRLGG
ncbi:MAG: coniferyl-alcohol dehydrogenase [Acidimicrobiales bacterium]|nr:coniferyl-alcohol dehydrogenase [Acidimicrobiales bacterium]